MYVVKFNPVGKAKEDKCPIAMLYKSNCDGRGGQRLVLNHFDGADPWGVGWSVDLPSVKLVHFDGAQTMVKAITKDAVIKPPSGYGGSRTCTYSEVIDWVKAQHSFLFCDVWKFPEIPCWLVPRKVVLNWFSVGILFAARTEAVARFLTPVFHIRRAMMMDLMWRFDPPRNDAEERYYAVDVSRPYVDYIPQEEEEEEAEVVQPQQSRLLRVRH